MANFVSRFEKWGPRRCRFRPSWYYCGTLRSKSVVTLESSDKEANEKEVCDWISGASNKKYLITDHLTVTGFEFETVVIVSDEQDKDNISNLYQRSTAKLILCYFCEYVYGMGNYKNDVPFWGSKKAWKKCISVLPTINIFFNNFDRSDCNFVNFSKEAAVLRLSTAASLVPTSSYIS